MYDYYFYYFKFSQNFKKFKNIRIFIKMWDIFRVFQTSKYDKKSSYIYMSDKG